MSIMQKRFAAALIDFVFFTITGTVILFFLALLLCGKQTDEILYKEISFVFDIVFYLMIVFMYLYYVFSDFVLKGSGGGKKIVGIRISENGKEPDIYFALKHAGAKILASLFWYIVIFIYLCKGHIFYDEWLHIRVVEIEHPDLR